MKKDFLRNIYDTFAASDDSPICHLTNAEKPDEDGQRIVGLNTENDEINEGLIRFDIVFYVRTRNGLAQIIVNIEAQKEQPKGYDILNRAVFYVSRLISSQKERDFTGSNYNDIKQVFSIWICMNMEQNSLSHIHLVKNEMLEPCEWKGNLDLLNIVMVGVTDEIPEREDKYELHRLISTLLSDDLQVKTKLDIIGNEYQIPINSDIREDVNTMCNLAEGIEERAEKRTEKRTTEKFILSMYSKGYTLDQIADVADLSTADVKAVINKKPAMA